MRQIYVFTAGTSQAKRNLRHTIQNPRPFAEAEAVLGSAAVDELRALAPTQDGFYAWGAQPTEKNPDTWKRMVAGDIVFTYHDYTLHYVSTVLAKVHSPQLSERLWGLDPKTKKSWEYMYFLSEPRPVHLPLSDPRVAGVLGSQYRGFSRMETKKLFAKYGSADAFVSSVLAFDVPPDPESIAIEEAEQEEADEADTTTGSGGPISVKDDRARVMREIVRRRGQPKFRKELLQAYGQQCAVTGCTIEAILEAAHIAPYRNGESNQVQNGLLLRADIHTLFDLGMLRVTVDYLIELDEALRGSDYWDYQGKKLRLPKAAAARPSKQALQIKLGLLPDR